MSRSTNRFNPASTRARADAEAKEEHRFPRFLRRAGRQADRPRGRRRNGRRRDRALVAFLSFGIVAALAFLIGGYFYNRNDHDWTAVASVNGRDISRESLRGRMAVLAFLAGERARFINGQFMASNLSYTESSVLQTRAQLPVSELLNAARESLIDDELVRQLAARDGILAPSPADPGQEGAAYTSGDVTRRIRYVRFGLDHTATSPTQTNQSSQDWPAASTDNVSAATDRVRAALGSDASAKDIAAALGGVGWQSTAVDVSVGRDGSPADPSVDLDPTIAADALDAANGAVLGPATDRYGRVSLARVIGVTDNRQDAAKLLADARSAGVDSAAFQSWADGQALETAVRQHLLAGWKSGPIEQAHLREIVLGNAPTSGGTGPWVELTGLSVNALQSVPASNWPSQLPAIGASPATLREDLLKVAPANRLAVFQALVRAASATSPSSGSGEVGFVTKGQLTKAVDDAVFSQKVTMGDVIGPIDTPQGPQLFLIETVYSGMLDDRAQVAISEVRAAADIDPVALTTRFSPADVALAQDAGWRAKAEFDSSEAAAEALFVAAPGVVSDPFVLDGKLVMAIVDQRQSAKPDASMTDRLTLDGYSAWLSSEIEKAKISRNLHPLPELESAAPSTNLSASPASTPGESSLGPATQQLPTAAPVKTDQLGLPALP